MSKTYQQYWQIIQGYIKDKSPETLLRIKEWVNEGDDEIWNAFDWHFKEKRLRFNTVAQYSTGTATITKGSTALTIVGGDLTGLENYKFTSAIGEPWFRISEVAAGGASATLDSPFSETALSGSTFVVYKDEYEVSSDIDEIISIKTLRDSRPVLEHVGLDTIERFENLTSHDGRPAAWYIAPRVDNTENIVVGVWPIPDDTYPIEVRYNRIRTPMSAASDTSDLPNDFDPLIIAYALEQAATYDYLDQESVLAARRFERLLHRKKTTHAPVVASEERFRGFDEDGGGDGPFRSQMTGF